MAIALSLGVPPDASFCMRQTDASSAQSSQEQQPPPDTTPQEQTAQTPITNQPVDATGAQKPASKKHKRHASQRQPDGEPRKIVIRQGSTPEATAQLAPGMSEEKAVQQRQDTEQLLTTTEGSLQQLQGRNLNAQDQETMSQIRNYLTGSRSALKDNDPQRAHTLAFKAHLLADELAKH